MISGHLYGPPAPTIAFYSASEYLGEVRGHPSDVEAAARKLMTHAEMLEPGPQGRRKQIQIRHADSIRLYCGDISMAL